MNIDGKLVLVGAGKMGGAMLQGGLSRGVSADRIVILDPSPAPEIGELIAQHKLAHNPAIDSIDGVSVLMIAVKPQVMAEVLPGLRPLADQKPLILSVAAGKTTATFEAAFGADKAVIRAMPNTPAAVGRGITVIYPNANVSPAQLALGQELLSAIGEVATISDEALMDPVTAVSGSGPAYVFYMTECLAEAGVKAGLPADLAMTLARATIAGAGELMRVSGIEAAVLRKNVTSPNGTTAAALDVLMAGDGLQPLMDRAVEAASRRSRELAG